MRADLERAVLRRKAQAAKDPVQKVALLREVAEMAERANDYVAFKAALKEYQDAVLACPSADLGPALAAPAPAGQKGGGQ